jgi:beta-glucosidase-like glycosyl hydrolase
MRVTRLLFPALRWDERTGFGHETAVIEGALALGVGGFIIFGGEAGAVRDLTAELRRRSAYPLLIGADLERGAGQQFRGATPLPPVAGLGALDDLEATWRAGELTAREARALGVDWVYAPVADLDIEPRNPIVGSRAFGSDPVRVAAQVVAWTEGCRAGGALSCAKHFPGHGRTASDSHLGLPLVEQTRATLEADLLPFREAIRAGVDAVMTAHVAYPALDPSGVAATLSPRIVTGLLREELGFGGVVVTDAMIMEGVLESGRDEASAAVRAVAAGCDALLYPQDPAAVAAALTAALGGELPEARVTEAIARIEAAAARAATAPAAAEWGREADRSWAVELAVRTIRVARGWPPALLGGEIDLVTVDDDLGGPYPPPSRETFRATLRGGEINLREVESPQEGRALVVALYADIRGWKGRPGLSGRAVEMLARVTTARPDAVVVLFGHQRLAAEVPGEVAVLAAWGGEALMQEAAARWLLQR